MFSPAFDTHTLLNNCEDTALLFCSGNQIYQGDSMYGSLGFNSTLNFTDSLLVGAGNYYGLYNPHSSTTFSPGGAIVSVGKALSHKPTGICQLYFSNTEMNQNVHQNGGAIGLYGASMTFSGGDNVLQNNTARDAVLGGDQLMYFESSVHFTICPPGKYYDSPLQYVTEKPIVGCPDTCGAGTYANKYGERVNACPNCPAGYFCPDILESPTPCPAGKYNREDRRTRLSDCRECPTGYYMDEEASVLCLPCLPGTYQDKVNSTKCKDCRRGEFQNLPRETLCRECPEGFYQGNRSAPLCFPCLPGKMQHLPGQHTCEDCENGRFQTSMAQTACERPDKVKVAVDGVAVIDIPPGFEVDCADPDSGVCEAYSICPAGKFSSLKAGRPHCKTCVDANRYGEGYESPTGSTTCTECPKGKFVEHGDGLCSACPAGYFQSDTGQTSCTACPAGYANEESEGESACFDQGWEKAQDCTSEQYLNDTDMNPREWRCATCPLGGSCVSTSVTWATIAPLFGWWKIPEQERAHYWQGVFAQCMFPPACLGGSNPSLESLFADSDLTIEESLVVANSTETKNNSVSNASCSIRLGFKETSRLCHACASNCRREGQNQCATCPDPGQNWGLIILGVLTILVILVYSIRTTLTEGSNMDLSQSAKKILLNYLQVVALARTFPLRWPSALTTLFGMQGAMSTLGEHVVNVDCLVDSGSSAGMFFWKQGVFALLPLFSAFLAFVFWFFYGICTAKPFDAKRTSAGHQTTKDKWVTSVTIIIFLVYPTLCEHALGMFSCKWIGSKQYLQVDLEEPCFEGRHTIMIVLLAVPQLLVYVLGLPVLVLVFLIRNNGASGSQNGNDNTAVLTNAEAGGLFSNPVAITRWGLFFKG
jgi:hypothetical protein